MKKNIILILSMIFLLFVYGRFKLGSDMEKDLLEESNLSVNTEVASKVESKIELAEGEACLPYSPEGQVLYEFEATSEIPEIEIEEPLKTTFDGAFTRLYATVFPAGTADKFSEKVLPPMRSDLPDTGRNRGGYLVSDPILNGVSFKIVP